MHNATSLKPNTPIPLAEKFVSINGEGLFAGKLSAFIRFAGCNLRCSYCDTVWAQDKTGASSHTSVNELVQWVKQQGCACVTITGGEPLLQSQLPALIEQLATLNIVQVIEIETNGSLSIASLRQFQSSKLHITMDYKLPSSNMQGFMNQENFALLSKNDVVKFVVGSDEDLHTMRSVLQEHQLDKHCNVIVSPVFGKIEPSVIVDFMKKHALNQVKLQLQLHKVIWPNEDRAV